MHRLVRSPMHASVALFVTLQAFRAHSHRPCYGLLVDGAEGAGAGVGHGLAGIHAADLANGFHVRVP